MRILYIFQVLFLSIFSIGCDEDEPQQLDEREFVPGDVAVGIKSGIPINLVFDLMNEKEVFIQQMSGFYNYSTLPTDSLNFVKNILISKPYTNKWGGTGGSAYIVENRIVVTELFFQMDLPAQEDWLFTMTQLQLNDLQGDTKNILIKVSPGTEKYWMDIFRKHAYVTFVEPNYIGGLEIF